ncbi:hypothetical protein N7481_007559 [Penicillium waksmanii]|uniref:uncharacterized protein n=1 Tax=Penicillium waksmanii TaxID=69791 RepID=UPI002548D92D|nr:uncharacterized protein N7481_007559 [Penicillium waksmanii]KAJ5980261.1 hypothetical protein N7481_007559 [Penicillium waksmanii]
MKGFVGGIPLALLAAAAQAQAMERTMNVGSVQPRNHDGFGHPEVGGTALGGPSGNDEDGTFNVPYAASIHTHSDVNEFSKDDHSVKIKDTDVYPPNVHPGPALGPGAGPFPIKRSWPSGGTAEGGPSGNDEGQTFNMPITGNFNTEVNESSEDDHSVDIKNKNIHPAPVVAPVYTHPRPHFEGPPAHVEEHPADDNNNDNFNGDHFNVAQNDLHSDWVKRGGPPHFGGPPPFYQANGNNNDNFNGDHFGVVENDHHVDWVKRSAPGGTALGGPGGGGHGPAGYPEHASGGTALGGPSGDDEGISWGRPITADIHSHVNEYHKDDHSVDIKHKDIHPEPVYAFGAPYKRHWGPHNGGTALGGPSGDDEGQTFNMPITVNTHTGINEYAKDDHSVKIKDTHVHPAPVYGGPGPYVPHGGYFRRAYSPDRVSGGGGGGTAEGGPSGTDGGENFGSPIDVGVDTGVNEHSEDNHAVKIDSTTEHPHYEQPELPWMTYPEATTYEVPSSPPAHEIEQAPPIEETHEVPQAPPQVEHHEEVPQCAAETHEVVRTVTKTHFKEVHPTATTTVYEKARTSVVTQAAQTSVVTLAAQTSAVTQAAQTSAVPQAATPMNDPESKIYSSAVLGSQAAPSSSNIPYQSYNYNSQRPMSTGAYSMIPVNVPAPSSTAMLKSMATPSASQAMPSGADAMNSASPSATPSHGMMFQGAATRASSGIFSAIAAVAGVLAFVL